MLLYCIVNLILTEWVWRSESSLLFRLYILIGRVSDEWCVLSWGIYGFVVISGYRSSQSANENFYIDLPCQRLATLIHLPLRASENSVPRGSRSVSMHGTSRTIDLFTFSACSEDGAPKPSIFCLLIVIKIIVHRILLKLRRRCSSFKCLNTYLEPYNSSYLTADVYAWLSIQKRMSRRRHNWLRLVNANRNFGKCEDSSSDKWPPFEI